MKNKVVINKSFDNLEKIEVPETFSEFVLLCFQNNFKCESFEDMVIIQNIVFHNKGKVGFVVGINEIKFVVFNRTMEQLWLSALSLLGEQK